MSTPDRAAWFAAAREVLGIVEADSSLPLPFIAAGGISWGLHGGNATPAKLAALEASLPCEFTEGVSGEDGQYFRLSGEVGGVPVVIDAWASSVAERKVTGTAVTEAVGWVRKPAGPESGERA